jgi:predicted MFS family arabinose efflux permease
MLPVVSDDLGVSVGVAGQLRAISGLTAVVMPRIGRVLGLRRTLLLGTTLLAVAAAELARWPLARRSVAVRSPI